MNRKELTLRNRSLKRTDNLREPEGQLLLRSKNKNHQEPARNIKLAWREGKKAPVACRRHCDAIVDGNKVYFQGGSHRLFIYNISDNYFLELPKCPFSCSRLAILNGQLANNYWWTTIN